MGRLRTASHRAVRPRGRVGPGRRPVVLVEKRLRDYFYGKQKKIIYIRADEGLNYGFIIEVLDIAKKAGIETTGLITEQKQKEKER